MIAYGFVQSFFDYCLFTEDSSDSFIIFIVYIDDVLITSPIKLKIMAIKRFVDDNFTIKNSGKYFFSLQLARSSQGMFINEIK